ncbi:MAG: PAS domain-containing protein [Algoriphagus sp.]|uniref:PAS domain-containing protein n=1 Tax=Algoriphagus sp. TaxID=1872435 RepID=UPI002736A04E|nr:PAS domain-containing protein [Algoriphagus sp.]MDP3472542.1 PAS domain-containing protein [Algoriphagus sp.]
MENSLISPHLFDLLAEAPEKEFDEVTALASTICQVPASLITILNSEKQLFKSQHGLDLKEIALEDSFCSHALLNPNQVMIVRDAREDPRFKENTLVTQIGVVFYAGIPLTSTSGIPFGALCVLDYEPRELSAENLKSLQILANQVVRICELKKSKLDLIQIENRLKEERKRLWNIIDATQVGTWEWHITSDLLIYSRGWAEMIGYTLEELGTINRETRNQFVHPEDLTSSNDILYHYLNSQKGLYECEVRMRHKKGHWVWILDRGQIMNWDEAGKPLTMFGTHTDITAQVTASEQLYLREKRFKKLIENSDDAIAIIGLDGSPSYVSGSIERVLGYTEAEALNLNLNSLVHPDDLEEMGKRMKISLENPGIPVEGHTSRVLHKDGSWRYLSATITNMLHDPVINGIIDNFKDVTEEVLANNRLIQREKLFRTLAQEGADLVCILDLEGNYHYLSPNYPSYLGLSVEELLGKNSFEFVHPDDLPGIIAEFSTIVEAKQIKSFPYRFKHKNDGWRWIQSVGTNLLDDPDILGIVVNSVDVTEVLTIQHQLKASNERFELVLKAGSECIWDHDPLTQNLHLTAGFRDNFGMEILSEDQNNAMFNSLIHPEDRAAVIADFRSSLKNKEKEKWVCEFRIRHKDGHYVHVRDKAVILRDEAGNPVRVVGALQDISQEHFDNKLDQIEREVMQASISENAVERDLFFKYLSDLEVLLPGMKASIMRIENSKLANFVSPSLDKKLLEILEGLPIGENQGSCGTAAFLKQKVIVEDVFQDKRWEKYSDLAKEFSIGACWSFPIVNSEGNVVATLANYFPHAKPIEEKELQVLERTSTLVTILVAKFGYLEKIRLNNERYELINKSTNEAIFDWDVAQNHFAWGESFFRVFGHDFSQKTFTLDDWVEMMHPDDVGVKEKQWQEFLKDSSQNKWTNEFRIKKSDSSYAYIEEIGYMIRDENGAPIRMIGVLRDQSVLKTEQFSKELQREVMEIFKGQASLGELLTDLIRLLSDVGGFVAAEFWLSGLEDSELILSAKYLKNPSHEEFYNEKITQSLTAKNGLHGKVWITAENQLWNDLDQYPEFIRKKTAKKFGFKSAIGLPVLFDDRVLGVLILFSDKNLGHDQNSILIFNTLKDFLGKEIKRKQQEEELRLFFESAPEILAIASPNGYFTKVNPAFCELLGYSMDELTHVPFENFLHPDDIKSTVQEFSETISADRKANNFTNRYRAKSGDYRYISWNSSDIFGQDGYVFAYGRDVTEFKKLENLLDTATKMARLGAWEVDFSKPLQSWSKITQEIFETSYDFYPTLEEGINFYREDYREFIQEKVQNAITFGENFDFEVPIITAKGNERWVRSIGEAEFVEGTCTRIFGSIQDIHDRKQVEDRLKSVSDNIPGVIFQYVLRPDGTDELRFVSKGSKLIWGLDPRECVEEISKVWLQIIPAGDLELVQKSIMDSATSLDNWSCEWRNLTLEGKIRWHQGIGTPRRQSDGSIVWDSLIMDVTDRKNLENLLEQSARMSKIGSWEVDLISNPLQLNWSATVREILEVDSAAGLPLEEAYQVYLGESKIRAMATMNDLINHGVAFDAEFLLMTSKGNQKWIRCIGQADTINGKVNRVYGSFQDIHKRKITELNLLSLFEEKNKILESIGDAFFAVDQEFTVTYWNHMSEKLLRTPREIILGKNLWDVFPGEINKLSHQNYSLAMETGQVIYFEDYYAPINTWFSISIYPSDSGLTVYFKDVTLAKQTEERIRLSNERFERVVEATNDAIWDYQIEEDNLFWGKGFHTLFGYNPEVINPDFEFLISCIHPDDRQRISSTIQTLMGDGKTRSWNEEYRFKKADGTYAVVMDRATFIRDEVGTPLRAIGAMIDITERKAYEQSLQELNSSLEIQAKELAVSNAELEQFAYVASHDLQEPLRMVSSFLSLLERKHKDQLDEKALQYIGFAIDGAVRMRRIILDLLEYSRVGKQNSRLEWVQLPSVVEEIKQLQRKIIQEKKAEIKFEGIETLWTFKPPLLQIMQNLIGNALKYSKPDVAPKICILAIDLPTCWQISVSDNGLGIKEEYFDKIFILFQRLHRKEEYEGTGIGLAIVKKIVEGLGGKIWVESEYQKGSIFHFTIAKPTA